MTLPQTKCLFLSKPGNELATHTTPKLGVGGTGLVGCGELVNAGDGCG